MSFLDFLNPFKQQLAELRSIRRALESIMATQAEHAQQLRAFKVQLDKARDEITAAIQALKDALAAGGNTTPDVDSAMVDLGAAAQTLDDLHPDAP